MHTGYDNERREKNSKSELSLKTEDFMSSRLMLRLKSTSETWDSPKNHSAKLWSRFLDKEITSGLAYVLKATWWANSFVKLSDPPWIFISYLPLAHAKHSGHDRRSFHWHLPTIFQDFAYWSGFEYATGIPINWWLRKMQQNFKINFMKLDCW